MDHDHVVLYLVQCDYTSLENAQYEQVLSLFDIATQERAKRFFHRADAWRFLVGRLLRSVAIQGILKDRTPGSSSNLLLFKETQSGKPYLDSPLPSPALGFNLSHDANAVLLVLREKEDLSLARDIGVDVMRVAIPDGETLLSFIESISITLTTSELDHLRTLASQSDMEASCALFKLWTIKEAYTKALGLGLGFDMKRIQYNFETNVLQVDGSPLVHWRVRSFRFGVESEPTHTHVGAVCYRLDEEETGGLVVSETLTAVRMEIKQLITKMEQMI
ncbi:hypothetical protein M408DRAFT_77017 [Serendipita vermifera MAFF 305830]|uniref:holo-[acyl-carrier-protein] synthase n=1 Tax=Serendipita vermifera MAFF 305830 TaxID=933852 RepID=A0A0C2WBB3_SERVB|nr:hypothetical protein M408DRAFT_77017 [Serendipita vermifera MAFF 305830]